RSVVLRIRITTFASMGGTSIVGTELRYNPNMRFQELDAGEVDTVVIGVEAIDARGVSSGETLFTVEVTGTNDAPTLEDGDLTVPEDGPSATLDLSTLGDDADAEDDGGTLDYALGAQSGGGVFTLDGTDLVFDPNGEFDALDAGDEALVTVALIATDSRQAGSPEATVTVTITGENDAPEFLAGPDVISVEDGDRTVTIVGAVDVDGDDVPEFSVGGDDGQLFEIDPATGELSFIAPPDFDTPLDQDGDNRYEVTVSATDGEETVTRDLSVDVLEEIVNVVASVGIIFEAPSGLEGDAGVTPQTFAITRSGDLSNEVVVSIAASGSADGADVIGVPTTVTLAAGAMFDTFNIDIVGDFLVEADETVTLSIAGIDRADHAVGQLSSDTFTILNDDAAPVAEDDEFDAVEDVVLAGDVSLNDDDAGDGPGEYQLIAGPAVGLLQLAADGTFTYDQQGAFDGLGAGDDASVSFSYRFIAGSGLIYIATAQIDNA
ncbi:MAG: Ig-like domain-containing protein, partial [Planctomycetota bacterium]